MLHMRQRRRSRACLDAKHHPRVGPTVTDRMSMTPLRVTSTRDKGLQQGSSRLTGLSRTWRRTPSRRRIASPRFAATSSSQPPTVTASSLPQDTGILPRPLLPPPPRSPPKLPKHGLDHSLQGRRACMRAEPPRPNSARAEAGRRLLTSFPSPLCRARRRTAQAGALQEQRGPRPCMVVLHVT